MPEKIPAVSPDPGDRSTREQTVQRILDAAEELFSSRNPLAVTVREVAEKAGVTHALVHQYVGSKDDLLKAVVERCSPRRLEMMAEIPDFRGVAPLLASDVLDRTLHSRTMIRSAMDGVEYTSMEERLVSGQALLALARQSVAKGASRHAPYAPMDPRIVVAAITALAYGWVATESWVVPIFDLQDDDPEHVRAELLRIVSCLTELVFPLAEDESDSGG